VEQSVGIRTFDTRYLPSEPEGRVGWAGASQTVLIQLSERWW
jgi:hypothetical protein